MGGSVVFRRLLRTILLRVTKEEALECIRRLIVRLSKIVGSSYIDLGEMVMFGWVAAV
jgi:hypothetical protein